MVVNAAILLLVPPHRAAAVAEQPIALRYRSHGGSGVVLVVLVSNHPSTTAAAVSARCRNIRLSDGSLRLCGDVVTHVLAVGRYGLLSRTWWKCVRFPRAEVVHLKRLKVGAEVELIHERRRWRKALVFQTVQNPRKEVGVVEKVHD